MLTSVLKNQNKNRHQNTLGMNRLAVICDLRRINSLLNTRGWLLQRQEILHAGLWCFVLRDNSSDILSSFLKLVGSYVFTRHHPTAIRTKEWCPFRKLGIRKKSSDVLIWGRCALRNKGCSQCKALEHFNLSCFSWCLEISMTRHAYSDRINGFDLLAELSSEGHFNRYFKLPVGLLYFPGDSLLPYKVEPNTHKVEPNTDMFL